MQIIALVTLLVWSAPAGAVVTSHLLPLQGRVSNAWELPLIDGNLTVRIYDQTSGGQLVYDSQTDFTGAIHHGRFTVTLGSGTELQLNNELKYYLEIDVDGVEIVGDESGGRLVFYPDGGDNQRSDLETRISNLETHFGLKRARTAESSALEKKSPARAAGSVSMHSALLGTGNVKGGVAQYAVEGNLLLQPVGIHTRGDTHLKLGPYYVPNEIAVGVKPPGPGPRRYLLHACHPNPFNPRTVIRYELPQRSPVTLRIFDNRGRLVTILRHGEEEGPGITDVPWDGTDNTGRIVASGVYFYRLDASGFSATRRMVLLK